MPEPFELRHAIGTCSNCSIEKGEVAWGGPEPDYRWLCLNCGEPYARRRTYLKAGQVPAGTDVVPKGFTRFGGFKEAVF